MGSRSYNCQKDWNIACDIKRAKKILVKGSALSSEDQYNILHSLLCDKPLRFRQMQASSSKVEVLKHIE